MDTQNRRDPARFYLESGKDELDLETFDSTGDQ